MPRRVLLILAMAALSMAFLAACNGDDDIVPVEPDDDGLGLADDPTPEGEEPDEGAARTDDDSAAGQTGGSPADDDADLLSDQLEVTLVDYEIEMDSTADEGMIAFIISNDGEAEHGISIISADSNGNGDEDEILGTMMVDPGQEEQLELELEAGEYIVFCPVGDHRDEHGMETTLTVEPVEDDGDGEDEEEAEDEAEEDEDEDADAEDDQ